MNEENTFDCPICSTTITKGTMVCPTCGADLAALVPDLVSDSEAPPESPEEEPSPFPEEVTAPPQTDPSTAPTHPSRPASWPLPDESAEQAQQPRIPEPPISEEDTQPRAPIPPAQQPPTPPPDYGYYENYDDEGLPRLPWRPIVAGIFVAAVALIILALLSGAGVEPPAAPTTDTPTATETLPPLPTDTPTTTETPTTTPSLPPTETPTITPTPPPEFCCREVQEDDDLWSLYLRCGWETGIQEALPTAVAINDNVPNIDLIPGPGSEVCVPWPEGAQPSGGEQPPEGEDGGALPPEEDGQETGAVPTVTEEVVAAASSPPTEGPTATPISLAGVNAGQQAVAAEASPTATPTIFTGVYEVREGDTLISAAVNANTDVSTLATLNPQIDWSTCDFTNPGGGPGCSPPLNVSQQLKVPVPTWTPSPSPTPSGSETPTFTPTPTAPMLLSPAGGTRFTGNEQVTLRWVPVHPLGDDEIYLVHVEDQTTGQVFERATRQHQITLPADPARPESGAHEFAWTVLVAQSDDHDRILSGPAFEVRAFVWEAE